MTSMVKDKRRLLAALLMHAEQSDTFNPHVYKDELMRSLSISEAQFNIIQKRLGNKYCHFVDSPNGKDRYSINVSECLAIQEQYASHGQLVRLAVLVAVLGAVLAFALIHWFGP